ncbi:dephospho-CoA kinase [uncultured Bifidobacterium sp.]|uniref:dephospho-CoA kinase n=1 Tax=uncultured Bifidobacterium sp. TaxID=165187 RepID=UPI0028DB3971|nr:dephospho-CoA kinase [uncultured Bifidobacterium sp.]
MALRVALTGGIAAGKSTVARRLSGLGIPVIDYDLLARRAVEPGGEGLRSIVRSFGAGALDSAGGLDRRWMANHVFGRDAAPGAREALNGIVHPIVFRLAAEEEARSSSSTSGVVVHDVPLLVEVIGRIPFRFDHVVTVEAPEGVRVARMLATRGMTRDQALGRIAGQSTARARRRIADVVVDSARPMEEMLARVDSLAAQWTLEASRRHTGR